jgi:hypothetical protein
MNKVALPAVLNKVETRADRSLKLVFETRELGEDAAVLFGMAHTEGWLLYSPNEIKEADIPDEQADAMTGQKTQAQRLRGVIYRLWELNGKKGAFDNYYTGVMEQLIDQLKEKLN